MMSLHIRRLARKGAFLLLGAALTAPLFPSAQAAAAAPAFKDVSGSYAESAILRLAKLGIVSGTSADRYSPARSVTRAELATLIARTLGLEPVQAAIPAFRDVARSSAFYPMIQAAVNIGWIGGRSADRFEPAASVTREEAAVMLLRALKRGAPVGGETVYRDQERISPWAEASVLEMNRLSLMAGDQGYFRPKAAISRAEAAVLLDRIRNRAEWSQQFETEPEAPVQMGWQYNSTTEQFKQQASSSGINTLSPRWLFVGPKGLSSDSSDAKLVQWAHSKGKKVWVMVGNRSRQADTHALLSQSASRSAAVKQLAASISASGADGINLDFENVAPEDRQNMTQFVSELAKSLHAFGAVLSVSVSPDTGSDWTEAFDYAALGSAADYIVLMGYDEHWSGGQNAGAVASLPWVARGLGKLQAVVPAAKTILGLPFYTRDWSTAASGIVTSADLSLPEQNGIAASLGLRPAWSSSLSTYTASYYIGTVRHQIWLEDSRSLSAKMSLALQSGAAGFAYWYMGGESPDVWAAHRNAIRYAGYSFS
ncbi:S-layer homology domain-containing protein [Paenibacillus humicus]|uniref:S-layer homology domain-containing protein n=1 Tax=Paenibacillus humicus TaxID=412861 RepID=UPI003F183A6C